MKDGRTLAFGFFRVPRKVWKSEQPLADELFVMVGVSFASLFVFSNITGKVLMQQLFYHFLRVVFSCQLNEPVVILYFIAGKNQ